MKIAIPDDYQDAVKTLDCFQKLNGQHVIVTHEHISQPEILAARLQGVEHLCLLSGLCRKRQL
jgi:D-3-phosphoglycerate dehydrogenase